MGAVRELRHNRMSGHADMTARTGTLAGKGKGQVQHKVQSEAYTRKFKYNHGYISHAKRKALYERCEHLNTQRLLAEARVVSSIRDRYTTLHDPILHNP